MQISKFKIFFFFTLIFQTNIFAAGIIDQTFGANGTLNLNFGNQTNAVDADVKTDGKIVVAGTVANVTSGKDIFVAQYNPNGTLDTTFGSNGVTIASTNLDETITDLEIQADGKIIVVGQKQAFEGVNGLFDFLVVRYNAAGQLDGTFGNGGFVTVNQNQQDILNKVTVQADGKIVAVGNTVESTKIWATFRFNSNGSLDSGFSSTGFRIDNWVGFPNQIISNYTDVEVLLDGRIITGYSYLRTLPSLDDEVGFIARIFSSNGTPVDAWSSNASTFRGFTYGTFDCEVLSSGNVAITSGIGTMIIDPNSGFFVRKFTQNGNNLAKSGTGNFVVSGGQYRGNIRTYSSNIFIGSAVNLPSGKLAAQTDGKFLILTNSSLTRVKNLTSQATREADFDNNGKTDLIVHRPGNNTIYFLKDNGNYTTHIPLFTSANKFIPEYSEFFPGSPTAFRNNVRYWSNGTFREEWLGSVSCCGFATAFGSPSDLPIGGDYDGDGNTNIATFSANGDWTYRDNQNIDRGYHWGTTGDKPVPADYDNDGITDYAIFRPSTGVWWIHRSSNDSYFTVPFGLSADIPLTGDYDADGKADFVVYRPSNGTWYLQMTTEGFKAVQFGLSTDIPVPGDYDGDGKHDVAVFRNGIWYLLQSRDGFAGIQWGTTGDVPVTVRYDNQF
jgi:uncharacterized delta-60 repeat protein